MQVKDLGLIGIGVAVVLVLGVLLPQVEKRNTHVPVEVLEERIEDTTEFYTIGAQYPRDERDSEGKMREYVEYKVAEAREEWKTGGEAYEAEKELSRLYPDRPAPKYELLIGYETFASEKLGTVTYQFMEYRFTGGAHGNTNLALFTFNDAGQIQIDDILDFDNGKDIELTRLLSARLVEVWGGQTSEEAIAHGLGLAYLRPDGSFDHEKCGCDGFFFPSNFQNFIITDTGLTFVMNQYQVAAYAVGMPEVSFTWSELAPFMRSTFDLPLD